MKSLKLKDSRTVELHKTKWFTENIPWKLKFMYGKLMAGEGLLYYKSKIFFNFPKIVYMHYFLY